MTDETPNFVIPIDAATTITVQYLRDAFETIAHDLNSGSLHPADVAVYTQTKNSIKQILKDWFGEGVRDV